MPITLLLIEDDLGDRVLVGEYLAEAGQPAKLRTAGRLTEALAALAQAPADLLLADLSLPDAAGAQVIDALRAAAPQTPLIVLTGRDDPELARQLIERGAQDYLNKQTLNPDILNRAIDHAIERQRLRSQLEASLARTWESEANLAQAQAIAHIGSWQVNFQENPPRWWISDECYRIFGYPLGMPVSMETGYARTHPEDRDRVAAAWAAATEGAPDYDIEHRIVVDGAIKWLRSRGELTFDADGCPLRGIGTVQDITAEREAQRVLVEYQAQREAEAAIQEALAEAQRLAQARSDFLANMSHEIRTPLNVVIGLAQAARRHPLDAVTRRYFTQIEDAGQLLLGVVNDILDFSKIEAGKLELEQAPFRLGEAIDRALAMIAPRAYGKGLELTLREAADLPGGCRGDALRLTQILVNLLNNAVKFTEQGQVSLSVRRVSEPDETGGLVFLIADSGIGLSAEQRTRLFQPFEQGDSSTTRRFGGTGLGLAICKRLVGLMGGTIEVDSQPGRGAVFTVRLPLAPVVVPRVMPPVTPRTLALAGLTATETNELIAALGERGLDALELPAEGIGEVAGFDLILLAGAALAEAQVVQGARLAMDRGARLVVAVTPGADTPLPAALRGRAIPLERPLSARRLLEAGQPRPEPVPTAGPRLAGLRLLAVEDNPVNQLVLTELLNQEGAQVTLADHGIQALERLREQGAVAFDLVLTDIQMPQMDGYETTRRILALAPDLPVVGLTARAMPEERERCLATGMRDHVAKPIDIDELVAVIRRHATAPPSVSSRPGTDSPSPAAATPAGIAGEPPAEAAPAPPSPDVLVPVIDWEALERYFESNPEVIGKLIAVALQTQADTAAQLRDAAEHSDLKQIAFLTHSLKGLGGHLKARRVYELAVRAERAARQDQAGAIPLAAELAGALDELMAALKAGQSAGLRSG